VGTDDGGVSELIIPNGGGLGSMPTRVGSGRSGSISGSELGLFGLVAGPSNFLYKGENFLPGQGVPEHRRDFGPLASENGGSLQIFPVDFRR